MSRERRNRFGGLGFSFFNLKGFCDGQKRTITICYDISPRRIGNDLECVQPAMATHKPTIGQSAGITDARRKRASAKTLQNQLGWMGFSFSFLRLRVMQKVTDGNDAFAFLSGFQFWMVTKSHNGRIEIVIKHPGGEYLKVWSRKDETFIEAVDRLREKAVDQCTP